MAYEPGGVGTLAELTEFYRSMKIDTSTIELMNQVNDILSDIPFREANSIKGHETRVRTGLPDVYFRRLYRGTPLSRSQYSRVVEGVGMLEARMELDVKEKELYGATFNAYRLQEGKAFMEALRQKAAELMFYGDHSTLADEFDGFATRYNDLGNPHVVDAGDGEDGENTSMYLVAWGPDTVHGLFPKESIGGLKHTDLGMYVTTDSEARKFEVFGDLWSWNVGLAVRDWRAVVRICNIPVDKLYEDRVIAGSDSSTGAQLNEDYIDFRKLVIQAKNLIPNQYRNRTVLYCNEEVMTALEVQASDTKNVHLHYGEYFGSKSIPFIHSIPIRQCDVIKNNEPKVS
ncbi:MAG: hypothetical protein LIO94_11280 [Clostridiales bacterium]|nr:hypothetical protein [Clostridiales bacterium]